MKLTEKTSKRGSKDVRKKEGHGERERQRQKGWREGKGRKKWKKRKMQRHQIKGRLKITFHVCQLGDYESPKCFSKVIMDGIQLQYIESKREVRERTQGQTSLMKSLKVKNSKKIECY